jgi:chromosome segregation ATPase
MKKKKAEFNTLKEQLAVANVEIFKNDISEIKSLLSQINNTLISYQEQERYRVEIQKLNEIIINFNVKENEYKQVIANLNEEISSFNTKENKSKQVIANLNEEISSFNAKENEYKQVIANLNEKITSFNAKENEYKQVIANLSKSFADTQNKAKEHSLQNIKTEQTRKDTREKPMQSFQSINQTNPSFERRNFAMNAANRNDIHSTQITSNSTKGYSLNSNYENYASPTQPNSDQTNSLNYYYEKHPYLNSQAQHIPSSINPFKRHGQ